MPRLAANLSLMFNEVPFLDRFKAAADAGFKGVEFLFPYPWPADDINERLRKHGLQLVLFNLRPGDWDAGERGLAGLKGRQSEFQDAVDEAIAYAEALRCQRLHAMAGLEQHGADWDTYIENLAFAAKRAAPHNIDILIEPINTSDMPGYLLNETEKALQVIREVGAENLCLQFDLYHRHVQQGEVLDAIDKYAQHACHIQIAGPPDRGEPHPSDLDAAGLLHRLDELGYKGWVGCEYRPRRATIEGLSWIKDCALALS